jgi:hypothetical protein
VVVFGDKIGDCIHHRLLAHGEVEPEQSGGIRGTFLRHYEFFGDDHDNSLWLNVAPILNSRQAKASVLSGRLSLFRLGIGCVEKRSF